jgi:hypothetical protein
MKTTKKDFELFKKECQKWIDRFELNKYDVAYDWHKMNEANAMMNNQESGMVATISLSNKIDYDKFDFPQYKNVNEFIKEKAKHEVIHLLIGRYREYANSRFVSKNEISEAEEELVRKLEKIIK